MRFRDAAHAHEDLGEFIPGGIIDDACLRQIEDALEDSDGFRSAGTVDTVRRDRWDCGIVLGDAVELHLCLADFVAGCAEREIVARPGTRHAGDRHGCIDIHITAIVIVDDLDGRVALVRQIFGAPLAEPVAGHTFAVAVGGEDGLAHTGTGEEVGEYGVHEIVDVTVNIPPVHIFLVIGGRGRDRKVIALVPVPFRVDPV